MLSSAAAAPTLARAPAPRPSVTLIPKLNARLGRRLLQGLGIRVGDNKVHAIQLLFDHVVDRIPTCTANTKHGDTGFQIVLSGHRKVQSHV